MRISDLALSGATRVVIPAGAGVQRQLYPAAEARRRRYFSLAMLARLFFLAALLWAAALPLLHAEKPSPVNEASSAWPSVFEGRPLIHLPLSPVEQRFAERFPGRIGRFTDGQRGIIIRQVDQPTRLLHPSADCFRGLGYRVSTPRVLRRADGAEWRCFRVRRGASGRDACERISDEAGNGWTDVSAWYWAALLGRTRGPWQAVTVADAP